MSIQKLSTFARAAVIAGSALVAGAAAADDLQTVRVGWCTNVINSGAVPWAVAQEQGYFKEEGLELKLVPVKSGNDCVTFVANGELPYALPALEPMVTIVAKGFNGKSFFTLYNGPTWRYGVPVDSPVQSIEDLKGKRVGVTSMSSVLVSLTKGLFRNAGLDPEKNLTLVAVGAPANAALAFNRNEIDAVAMWDIATQTITRIGTPVRDLDIPDLNAPSLGMFTSEKYFADHRDEATRLARAYAKGVTFTLANPEAALNILYKVYPETVTPGVSREELLQNDLDFVSLRKSMWLPTEAMDGLWGKAALGQYGVYLTNLANWGIVDRVVEPEEFLTNELIDEINNFDAAEIEAAAKAHTAN